MRNAFNDSSVQERRKTLRNNMTEPERKLWYYLRNHNFLWVRFRRQYSVWMYILDFYAPEKRLWIEIDGDSHTDDLSYERSRTEFLESFNITVVRYANREALYNIDGVLQDLAMRLWYEFREHTPPNLP